MIEIFAFEMLFVCCFVVLFYTYVYIFFYMFVFLFCFFGRTTASSRANEKQHNNSVFSCVWDRRGPTWVALSCLPVAAQSRQVRMTLGCTFLNYYYLYYIYLYTLSSPASWFWFIIVLMGHVSAMNTHSSNCEEEKKSS